MMTANAYSCELRYWMHQNPSHCALGHQNMNVDNAYFWRDESGDLQCGVFDWGGLGSGSIGVKLWWWFYCSDYEVFRDHIQNFIKTYVDTLKEYGGGVALDSEELFQMTVISAIQQMAGL